MATSAILDYLEKNNLKLITVAAWSLEKQFSKYKEYFKNKAIIKEIIPYNQVWDMIRTAKVNVPLIGQSCTLDATFCGVPTLMWEQGGFFTKIAKNNDLLVLKTDDEKIIKEKLDILIKDKIRTLKYLKDLQEYLSDHLYESLSGAQSLPDGVG